MGALYAILQNRLYLGEIGHKGRFYPGEHQPLLERSLFDDVQALLTSNCVARQTGEAADAPSLLAGLLYDGEGRRMSPSHACKGQRRYRYYVSRIEPGDAGGRAWRMPAADLEEIVAGRVAVHLRDPGAGWECLPNQASAQQINDEVEAGRRAAADLTGPTVSTRRATLMAYVERIDVSRDQISIQLVSGARLSARP